MATPGMTRAGAVSPPSARSWPDFSSVRHDQLYLQSCQISILKTSVRRGWNFGFALGPLSPRQSTSTKESAAIRRPRRSSLCARYSGSLLVAALSRRFDRVWFGSFVRYDVLAGAVFENSPLVKTRRSVMAGFGLAWVFDQSPTLVHASQ
jgi:hypothetical protein